jgi:ankyrin repeat protein
VARLLAAGADPNAQATVRNSLGAAFQSTALVVAAGNGRLEAARLLLDAGADPSRADGDGRTPLMAAAGGDQLEVLRLLLVWGAAVDAMHPIRECRTAFHFACYYNHAECAEALVQAGCDVGLKTKKGFTGRELAEETGHAAVVAEQLGAAQAGTPPQPAPMALDADKEHAVRLRARFDTDQLVQARRGAWARVTMDRFRHSSLSTCKKYMAPTNIFSNQQAARGGHLEAARVLLDDGADPSRATSAENTPLAAAAERGHVEVLRLLLARGAAVDAAHPSTGNTVFHLACLMNHPVRSFPPPVTQRRPHFVALPMQLPCDRRWPAVRGPWLREGPRAGLRGGADQGGLRHRGGECRRTHRPANRRNGEQQGCEKDTKLAQKLGQLQPFIAVLPQECMDQLAYFGPT